MPVLRQVLMHVKVMRVISEAKTTQVDLGQRYL